MRVENLNELPPAFRARVEAALAKQNGERAGRQRVAAPPAPEFESELEAKYYLAFIAPRVHSGEVAGCEAHQTFELMPAAEYCGIRLPKIEYTPDFVLTLADGSVEVVEVKSKAVRRLQKGYTYRRRLFIETWARPRGWTFTEYISE